MNLEILKGFRKYGIILVILLILVGIIYIGFRVANKGNDNINNTV